MLTAKKAEQVLYLTIVRPRLYLSFFLLIRPPTQAQQEPEAFFHTTTKDYKRLKNRTMYRSLLLFRSCCACGGSLPSTRARRGTSLRPLMYTHLSERSCYATATRSPAVRDFRWAVRFRLSTKPSRVPPAIALLAKRGSATLSIRRRRIPLPLGSAASVAH